MSKLRISSVISEKPVRLAVELPASLHRDLIAYGVLLAQDSGSDGIDPAKLIAPMLDYFLKGDKAFKKLKNTRLNNGLQKRRELKINSSEPA